MASPPPLPHLNIPRKRGSISSVTSAAKKRKPSNLRNAYSPEAEGVGSPRFSRSASVESTATGGRKRRRKDGDTLSVAGSIRSGKGRGGTTVVDGEGGAGREGEDSEGDDDDDLEDEEMDAVLEGGKSTEAGRIQEAEHERILIAAMNPAQQERHAIYRRIRLKRETVRKLVNQTLSQSVPQPVILAVTSYSKAFIGDLVDRALSVRDEWAAARTHVPNPNLPPTLLRTGFQNPRKHGPGGVPDMREIQEAGVHPNAVQGETYLLEVEAEKGLKERLRAEDKGPLTPAHIREALRRYKRDRERTAARMGGRRLFR